MTGLPHPLENGTAPASLFRAAGRKRVFYVQITGWKEMDYGWYVNWRGKLKYGIVDKKLSFDLYDSDTVEGGYIARYDAANDAAEAADGLRAEIAALKEQGESDHI